MASRIFILVLTLFYFSTSSTSARVHLDRTGPTPVIHVINAIPEVQIRINVGIRERWIVTLMSRGQVYGFKAYHDAVYEMTVVNVYGYSFTKVDAYVPSRDIGRAAVYWKADEVGVSMSYDKANWKLIATWDI